jgi:hypothetical protein
MNALYACTASLYSIITSLSPPKYLYCYHTYNQRYRSFLGTHNPAKCLLNSLCPTVYMHITILEPLGGFSRNSMSDNFMKNWRMLSSLKWLHVGLVRTDISEKRGISISMVETIHELGAVSRQLLLMFLALRFFPPWRWQWHISAECQF